jgi:hypothetical protein
VFDPHLVSAFVGKTMTPQRITAILTLAGVVALGVALDRSGRQIVRPLRANQSNLAPAQSASDPALTQEEATIIRVAREITPAVVSVSQKRGLGIRYHRQS